MPSYRSLFRTPEFTPLLLGAAAQTAAQTVGGLALGTLVFRATGSPLLAALSMFGSSLAQVLGATFLLSGADRLPPRTALTVITLVSAAGTAAQALPACRPADSSSSSSCWAWSPRWAAGSAGGCSTRSSPRTATCPGVRSST